MSSTIYGCSQSNGGGKKHWIIGGKIDMSKVLDSIDNWTLEEVEDAWEHLSYGQNKARFMSLVKHECYPGGRGRPTGQVVHQVVVYPDDSDLCWRCQEAIPDKMVVLWKFMNHDALQYRKRNL
jgi:hypothetical protein